MTAPPAPTEDQAPVEQAAAAEIADGFPSQTLLEITFHRPDGGACVWYAWTKHGVPLGDRIDRRALAAGLDLADSLHIASRHGKHSTRGRIHIYAYPLRPVLADVRAGVRGPEDLRAALHQVITEASRVTGQTPRTTEPRWPGFGPRLLTARSTAR